MRDPSREDDSGTGARNPDGSGGGSKGGSSSGGGSGNSGGDSSSGGTDTEPDDSDCEAIHDEQGTRLTVVIENDTSSPIFLGSREQTCGTTPLFSITGDQGDVPYFRGNCSFSCEQLRGGWGGCPAICLFPPILLLEPGDEHQVTFDGLIQVRDVLPLECVEGEYGPEDDTECDRWVRIPEGPYIFQAEAGTGIECDAVFDGACEACESHPAGGCQFSGGVLSSGERLVAETELQLASDGSAVGTEDPSVIRIVFED